MRLLTILLCYSNANAMKCYTNVIICIGSVVLWYARVMLCSVMLGDVEANYVF